MKHGAYLKRVALTFIVLLICTVLVTVFVDAEHAFGTGLVPPLKVSNLEEHAVMYAEAPEAPELLIIGSSMAGTVSPRCVSALTGKTALGFTFNGGDPEDLRAIMRYVYDLDREPLPSHIILGLDPKMFVEKPRTVTRSPTIRAYTSTDIRLDWMLELPRKIFSFQSMRYQYLALFERPEEKLHFEVLPDGSYLWPEFFEESAAGTYDPTEMLESQSRYFTRLMPRNPEPPTKPWLELHPGRTRKFRATLEMLRDRGVRVDIYVAVYHPDIGSKYLTNTYMIERIDELRSLLRDYDEEGLIHFTDHQEGEGLGCSEKEFADLFHTSRFCSTKLLLKMFPLSDGEKVPAACQAELSRVHPHEIYNLRGGEQ